MSHIAIFVNGQRKWIHEADGEFTAFIDGEQVVGYNRDMDLGYTEDGMAFDVEITVVNPDTGDHFTAVVDNLTNAMYWIVRHNLLPIREGYRERTREDFELSYGPLPLEYNTPEARLTADVAKALHAGWRAENLHPIILTITCHGDPELIKEGL